MAKLAHHVFFTLRDRSEKSVQGMLDDCRHYLDGHEGLIEFAVGRREPDYTRPVNMDYDVSLHTIFADRAAHDAYQIHSRHLEFIEKNKPNWAEIRVFDSNLES